VAALRFLPRPKQTSRRLTISLLDQKRTWHLPIVTAALPQSGHQLSPRLMRSLW
jgi:hypothetical protein